LVSSQNVSKITLGDEFDDELRQKLMQALNDLGAKAGDSNRFVAGSQDLEKFDAFVDGQKIRIEAETYVGLTVSGPADLLKKIQTMVDGAT
jgi:hypothetical protein